MSGVGTIVVGSGPGGATVARELAMRGEPVVLLERGRDWRGSRLYGTYPGALLYADRRALLFTTEGLNIIRPLMLGGATSMYCGCSAPPASWWGTRYGIHLDDYAADVSEYLGIGPLPAGERGESSTRIAEAGLELGMPWHPQDKFMWPGRVRDFDCGAKCMLGCRCGAKWNAAEWVDDAVANGAEVLTEARVDRVLSIGGSVQGVEGTRRGRHFRFEADRVILAAGGIGTAVLLRDSGITDAGRGMTMDTTAMVYGVSRYKGMGDEPPMTWSCPDDDLGVLYSTLIDPWLMYPIILGSERPANVLRWRHWGRTLGVMIKLKDEVSGEIHSEDRISKGLTGPDRERLRAAEEVAAEVLRRAGCAPDSLITTPLRGTHPASTARVGHVVDHDLQTEVKGLYVCDASVFPEALCRPTVLTIIALGRRLVDHLTDPTHQAAASAA